MNDDTDQITLLEQRVAVLEALLHKFMTLAGKYPMGKMLLKMLGEESG